MLPASLFRVSGLGRYRFLVRCVEGRIRGDEDLLAGQLLARPQPKLPGE